MEVPLPWERLLWSSRSPFSGTLRYALTDFRIVRLSPAQADEILLQDVGDVVCTRTALDHVLRTSTLLVHHRESPTDPPALPALPALPAPRRPDGPALPAPPALAAPVVLSHVRHGAQLAALIEWLAGDPRASMARERMLDREDVTAALHWTPRGSRGLPARGAVAIAGVMLIAVVSAVLGMRGAAATISHAPDDAIYPGGVKRSRAEIVTFMESEVLPWARTALAPIVGGADRVRCETCHGIDAVARDWRMPAVAALPEPHVKERGWETYSGRMDAQMRNAIYGYAAESENQTRAAHMREVVLPGMAALLRRPAYDFTRSYNENRSRLAFGCYHCHRVES